MITIIFNERKFGEHAEGGEKKIDPFSFGSASANKVKPNFVGKLILPFPFLNDSN